MASILRTLQSVEPKTRHYIRYYRISEIYEVTKIIKNYFSKKILFVTIELK